MNTGLDIDGVLAEFSGHFLQWFDFEDQTPPTRWDDPRFRDNFHIIADNEEFWMGIPPIIRGDQLAFKPTVYVTARPIPTEVTERWLRKHRFPKAPVITVGHDMSKVDALKGKVDIYLDDAVHNFVELNEAGVNCWIVTRSHNVDFDDGGKRVASLMDYQSTYLLSKINE